MKIEREDVIRAPWTAEQVEALNRWQASDFVHPYTCGSGYRTNRSIHPDGEGRLVATEHGWVCPNCDYRQEWAWAGSLHVEAFDIMRRPAGEADGHNA
jgi:hypothetical protein